MSYENPAGKPLPETNSIGYKLRLTSTFSGSILVALLLREDEAIGSIRCQDKEEYEWLRKRLSGSRNLEHLMND